MVNGLEKAMTPPGGDGSDERPDYQCIPGTVPPGSGDEYPGKETIDAIVADTPFEDRDLRRPEGLDFSSLPPEMKEYIEGLETANAQSAEREMGYEAKLAQQRINHEAVLQAKDKEITELSDNVGIDDLTRLPRQNRFYTRVEEAIARVARTGKSAAVLMIDLDNLNVYNDAHKLKHTAGNAAILYTVAMLGANMRPTDYLARTAGDEFGAVLEGVKSPIDVQRCIERARMEMDNAPLHIYGERLNLKGNDKLGNPVHLKNASFTVGYVFITPEMARKGLTAEDAYKMANQAEGTAKTMYGRNTTLAYHHMPKVKQ